MADTEGTRIEPDENELEVEQAKQKGTLLFRLWSQAKERVQQKGKETPPPGAEQPLSSTVETAQAQADIPASAVPEAKAAPKIDPNDVMDSKNHIAALYARADGISLPAGQPVQYSSFMYSKKAPTREERAFFKELQNLAQSILQTLDKQSEEPPVIDAVFKVKQSKNHLLAWFFAFPPWNGGAPLSLEAVKENLTQMNIKFGIKETLLSKLVAQETYFSMVQIAEGISPVDGIDGAIADHFPRERQIDLRVQEDGTINYKDLNWLHRVEPGDIICDVIPTVAPIDGTNLAGDAVKGRPGHAAIAPKGKNTVLTEDGLALVAETEGQVSFSDFKFKVEPLLTIYGNVDISVGNLDVIGNVVVQGDVQEGFNLKATGDIVVQGMAEGACIMADGDIQIGQGMNGNGHGVLEAKGNVRCKYLENCTVNASACVYSDSIVNCQIFCDDRVVVTSGRGVIIGGSITALNAIEARIIGNKMNRPTVLVLGSTPSLLREKSNLEEQVQALEKTLEEIKKDLHFIENLHGQATAEYRARASQLNLKLSLHMMQKSKAEEKLDEIHAQEEDKEHCRIQCDTLYPPTQITIGPASLTVRDQAANCNIYYARGEIVIGFK